MSLDHLIALSLAPLIGSFLGVVIHRLPVGKPIVAGRSRCDHCDHTLGPWELVPVLSFLWQRGQCRRCATRLSLFYPLIEFAALLVVFSAMVMLDGVLFWLSLTLGWCLLVLAVIDYRHLILPDVLTYPLILIGLAVAYWLRPDAIVHHMIGAVLGFSSLALIAFLYRRLRGRDGLGLGDAKLFAAAGAWLGWEALSGVLLTATIAALLVALAGSLFGDRLKATSELAFGPYLAMAFWMAWLFGPLVFA